MRSASSFWIVAVIECGTCRASSRFESTGVAMLYGRLATSLNRRPGAAASCSPTASITRSSKLFLFRSASSCSIVTFGRSISCSLASSNRWASISTVTTAAARSAIIAVSEPVPVPTSSTTSSRRQLGRIDDQLHQVQVDEKILPMPRGGANAHLAEALEQKGFGLAGHCRKLSAVGCQLLARSYG